MIASSTIASLLLLLIGSVLLLFCFVFCFLLSLISAYVSTVAGWPGYEGYQDGPMFEAKFDYPNGIGFDASGRLLVADAGNGVIRLIDLNASGLCLS